jgi:hypothetical protein
LAPIGLPVFITSIRRGQIAARHPARIIAKINSLVDPSVIDELYLAVSRRRHRSHRQGMCSLRPGLPGISGAFGALHHRPLSRARANLLPLMAAGVPAGVSRLDAAQPIIASKSLSDSRSQHQSRLKEIWE